MGWGEQKCRQIGVMKRGKEGERKGKEQRREGRRLSYGTHQTF